MRTSHLKNAHSTRRGAVTVEFAISALVFFFVLFSFWEFGQVMMIESFAENAAFRAARHAAVLGATRDEAVELVQADMSILGVDDVQVTVESLENSAVRDGIDLNAERIRVNVAIPLSEYTAFGSLFHGQTLEREAIIVTERPR